MYNQYIYGTELAPLLSLLQCCSRWENLANVEHWIHLEFPLQHDARELQAIYVHCYGGHGRTGIVACALLCLMLGVTSHEAVSMFNHLHSYRLENLSLVIAQTKQTLQGRETTREGCVLWKRISRNFYHIDISVLLSRIHRRILYIHNMTRA